jgi:hypothetical protein
MPFFYLNNFDFNWVNPFNNSLTVTPSMLVLFFTRDIFFLFSHLFIAEELSQNSRDGTELHNIKAFMIYITFSCTLTNFE